MAAILHSATAEACSERTWPVLKRRWKRCQRIRIPSGSICRAAGQHFSLARHSSPARATFESARHPNSSDIRVCQLVRKVRQTHSACRASIPIPQAPAWFSSASCSTNILPAASDTCYCPAGGSECKRRIRTTSAIPVRLQEEAAQIIRKLEEKSVSSVWSPCLSN